MQQRMSYFSDFSCFCDFVAFFYGVESSQKNFLSMMKKQQSNFQSSVPHVFSLKHFLLIIPAAVYERRPRRGHMFVED